ncbi:MAG: protein translocase SEC61 complex subunit gamma [Candidatus Woesearchaeota archaeon]|nr:protein translocase SEC61 complex subunit gamma [Candidatus Woesearchaeota archaeon]
MEAFNKLKAFYEKSKRVWLVLRKPTKQEFEMVAKVSAFGILILGTFGFLISICCSCFSGA